MYPFLPGCSPNEVTTVITQPNRVFYTSAAINQVGTADSIRRIKPGGTLFSPNLKVVLRSSEQRKIPKNKIWGYADEKGKVFRCFNKSFFQVLRIGDVVEYQIIEARNVGNNSVVYEPVIRFSKTLDSKIVNRRKKALADEADTKGE